MNRFFTRSRNFGQSILRKLNSGRDEFVNPCRFLRNVAGPFYTTGECTACGLPEVEAPTLLAPLDDSNFDTFFVRQPETPEETDQVINALRVCCVSALRYGGRDREIISKLSNNPAWCDYVITPSGELERTIDENGNWHAYWEKLRAEHLKQFQNRTEKQKSRKRRREENS